MDGSISVDGRPPVATGLIIGVNGEDSDGKPPTFAPPVSPIQPSHTPPPHHHHITPSIDNPSTAAAVMFGHTKLPSTSASIFSHSKSSSIIPTSPTSALAVPQPHPAMTLTSFPTPSPPADPRSWGARADADVDAGGEDAGSPPKTALAAVLAAAAAARGPEIVQAQAKMEESAAQDVGVSGTGLASTGLGDRVPADPVKVASSTAPAIPAVLHDAYDSQQGATVGNSAEEQVSPPPGLSLVETMVWTSDRRYGPLKVRDFAFPVKDPLHYGLPRHLFPEYLDASDSDGAAGGRDLDDAEDLSHSEDGDGPLSRYDESSTSIVSQFSTASASGGWRLTATVRCDATALLAGYDIAKALSRKFELHAWRFKKAKAMYEFRREGEVEMDLDEGEELVVVGVGDGPGEGDDDEMEQDEDGPVLPVVSHAEVSPTVATTGDRTASIDSPTSLNSPVASQPTSSQTVRTALYIRPRTAYQNIDRLLGIAIRTYPPGWVLAVKTRVKVKGKVARNAKSDQGEEKGLRTVRLDKDGRVRMRCKVVEAGLVPRNYVEVEGEENEVWDGAEGTDNPMEADGQADMAVESVQADSQSQGSSPATVPGFSPEGTTETAVDTARDGSNVTDAGVEK
ncbi:hypothetical protein M427DRAFT_57501 [Gonapodya prolifera JEL478]|uniref:Uncharacterized protein n=1 Tax=Gonapodya prolifera (strain JEL478) TaxID=1344416 RepID=A0A139ACV5_GONPJ|nr:hypothetical protein M427DRAFT_57501 [Gonapodya prolifera JEL478]|eukprot:KXS14600.1 hypothetical protein M427DRAFT_57501 [Gonapodya prolifera JEL478]